MSHQRFWVGEIHSGRELDRVGERHVVALVLGRRVGQVDLGPRVGLEDVRDRLQVAPELGRLAGSSALRFQWDCPVARVASCGMLSRLVGINHVALEVDEHRRGARVLRPVLRAPPARRRARDGVRRHGRPVPRALRGARAGADDGRHFGLVVDDKEAVRAALEEAGVEILPGRGLDFLDPWGNRIEIVDYRDIQFTKAPAVLDGMGLELDKRPAAIDQLREKGLL